jgi:glycosyltransferase involved in cell wall biosynthesis
MKILFLGAYRDGTGYGNSSINSILAMDAVGIDVVPRPLKFNSQILDLPRRIEELEQKSSSGSDVVIQHCLPEVMEYCGHFKKNIAMYCSETSNFISSNWGERLNNMDVAWVPCEDMKEAARKSNVKIPLVKIPYPVNMDKFERSYSKLPLTDIEDTFSFYTIAEMSKRKNLKALIQAFHTEFDIGEPVSLVIKSHKYGMDPKECYRHIESDCNSIKKWLKLYSKPEYYKREIIITDILTEEALCRLHATCDCFVLPSHGEAWCIPAFDAMCFGKTPIVTNDGGFKEFISNDNGWLVNCSQEQIMDGSSEIPELYTGRETWASVSVEDLRRCMREAYSNHKLRNQKSELGMARGYDFSYEFVGSLIKKELESYEQ